MSIVGTVGKIIIAEPELEGGNITQSSCLIRANPNIMARQLLVLFLKSPQAWAQYRERIFGTAVQRLNLEDIRAIEMPLPPVREQRRIVAKIDALSARSKWARAGLNRAQALAARAKGAVLAAAYRGSLVRGSRTSWQPQPLGQCLLDIRYGTAQKCGASGGVPVLRIPNVVAGVVDLTELKYADFNKKEVSKLALEAGDVLMVRSNGSVPLVGRSAVVDQTAVGMLFAGYLIRLRADRARVEPRFLQLMLASPALRSAIEQEAKSTSGVNNINSRQIEALPVPLPSLDEQRATISSAETLIRRIDAAIREAANASKLLARLDQSILAEAFRGELVPQDPADEPASVLLDRIRAERAGADAPKRRGRLPRLTS